MKRLFEIEDLIYEGFEKKSSGIASGGRYLQATEKESSVSTIFDEEPGIYELTLNYFDESDGVSEMSLVINGKVIETWKWDAQLGSHLANSTTSTSKTFKNLVIEKGDKIEFVGKQDGGEPLRVDSLEMERTGDIPAPITQQNDNGDVITIEAENMDKTGYTVKSNGHASGDKYVQATSNTSKISTVHSGKEGEYSLTLNYFDENDGVSEMSLVVDGKTIETWKWDDTSGGRLADSRSLTSKTFNDIELKADSVIEFVGERDGGEPLRVDSLTIKMTADKPEEELVMSVEAEDMKLNGFVVKSLGAASENEMIQARTELAKASTVFDGEDGMHKLKLHFFDENDGVSELSLVVDGKTIETIKLDKDLGSNLANSSTLTSKTFEDVALKSGSTIELVGKRDGGEPLRMDKLEVIRTGDLSNDTSSDSGSGDQGPSLPPVEDQGPSLPPTDSGSKPVVVSDTSGLKAFVGAEGFGADSEGGRGGKVVHVTNLKDSGEGSLRWALEDVSGPRIVVFDIEGQIALKDYIEVKNPYVTIAGQTAPGDGIVVTGARIKISTNDVIMRGMKIRPGDARIGENPDNRDSVSIGDGGEDVILDHNSFTWAIDETVAVWGATNNITISNNIIAESLNDSLHSKGEHGKGLIVGNKEGEENSHKITITKNLFASNKGRNPFLKQTEETEFINNYITNYGSAHQAINLGGGKAPLEVAIINNYIEDGQDTTFSEPRPAIDMRGLELGSELYIEGNFVEHHNKDQTHGKDRYLVNEQTFKASGAEILDTSDVKDYVLNNVGARVNGELDTVDSRILKEVKNGTTKIIDSQNEVRGLSVYDFDGDRVKDTDGDGMADWFEKEYAEYGFDYRKADDKGDFDGDGYTNIEEYINGLITGFDFAAQGGIYGTNGTDSFRLVDNAVKPIRLHDFDPNKDYLDISDVIDTQPNSIDQALRDFVKTSFNKSSNELSIYVDSDGSKSSAGMKLVAVVENAVSDNIIDTSNVIF